MSCYKIKDMIKKMFTELLETYYNGSFAQMVCDYIRSSGMTPMKVEQMLEEMRKMNS